MEAKNYIRQYEQLKNTKTEGIRSQQELEKKWMKLFKDMNFAMKRMSKKQKIELEKFRNKTLHEVHEHSAQIFKSVTKKTKSNFNELLKKNEKIYFELGSKGLINLVYKQEKGAVTFDEKIKEMTEKETLRGKNVATWSEEVEQLMLVSYNSLEEAYKTEEQTKKLYEWWNFHHKSLSKSEEVVSIYTQLCNYHRDLVNFLLKELGYTISAEECFCTREQKRILRTKGLLVTCQTLEKEKEFQSPMLKEIGEKISFVPPNIEFAEVRKLNRHFVVHIGPTNSGKTYQAIEALKKASSGVYLAPIRLLALEIQEKLNEAGIACNLKTGEEEVRIDGANHQSSTVEIAPFQKNLDVAVIDEIQMIEDPVRGAAWLRALFGLKAKEIHLCGAAHALPFILQLINACEDTVEVKHYDRQTPLIVEEEPYHFPYSTRKGDALIVFGKKQVIKKAEELRLAGYKVSVMYGKLPPDTRKHQVELFSTKQTDVIITTDAIGIGLNLPIERVVFLESSKFNGKEKRALTVQEVKQIAGRAGRKGVYEKGYVNALTEKEFIATKLSEQEEVITCSVLAPAMDLLTMEIGTLRQRLLAWKEAKLDVSYLEKADIEVQLSLLSHIEKWEHQLEKEMLLKSLYLSFDSNNYELLNQWKMYVEEMKNGKGQLQKPRLQGTALPSLETYYHAITLYFNFSKKLRFPYDGKWIIEEKKRVSNLMNKQMRLRTN